ncbi:MAG: hypothetical protein ACC682_14545 [Gemmatimonadota bacterium]
MNILAHTFSGMFAASTAVFALAVPAFAAPQPAPVVADTTYASQSSAGEVTLDVEPQWAEGKLVLDLSANTHSVDLSGLDLTALIRLEVGEATLEPSEAGSLDGHHAKASVTFVLEAAPAQFSVVIRDVPDVPVRTLTWPIEDTSK